MAQTYKTFWSHKSPVASQNRDRIGYNFCKDKRLCSNTQLHGVQNSLSPLSCKTSGNWFGLIFIGKWDWFALFIEVFSLSFRRFVFLLARDDDVSRRAITSLQHSQGIEGKMAPPVWITCNIYQLSAEIYATFYNKSAASLKKKQPPA